MLNSLNVIRVERVYQCRAAASMKGHVLSCTTMPADQWAPIKRSRDAQHHECRLWASPRSNAGLLISHWINFNLFCNTIGAQCPAEADVTEPSLLNKHIQPLILRLILKTKPVVALQRKTEQGNSQINQEESWLYLVNFAVTLIVPPWIWYTKNKSISFLQLMH